MNDQTVSMLVGFGVVVGLRLLDWTLPRGYMSRRVRKWSEPTDKDKPDDQAT